MKNQEIERVFETKGLEIRSISDEVTKMLSIVESNGYKGDLAVQCVAQILFCVNKKLEITGLGDDFHV